MSVENVTAELLTLRVIGKDKEKENASFLLRCHYIIYKNTKTITSPRQARDKHRGNSKKRCVFCRSSPRRRLPSQSQGLQRCGRGGVV
jgi:hypothetical protein